MAKFCTKCGRPLQEGEICNCSSQQTTAPTAPTAVPQAPSKAVTFFSELLNDFIGVFKNPVESGKAMTLKGNIGIAAVFIALQAIFTGLFSMVATSRAVKDIFFGFLEDSVDVDYASVFFKFLLCSIIMTAILAALLFVIQIKNPVNPYKFTNCISQVAVRSIFSICFAVVSIVICYINVLWGFGFYMFANFMTFVLLALISSVDVKKVKYFYLTTSAFIVFGLIHLLVLKILVK